MHTDFISLANISRNNYLLKMEGLFNNYRQTWFDSFAEHFQAICADIVKPGYALDAN